MEQTEINMREYLEYNLHFTKEQIEELYQKNIFLRKILSGDVADEIRFLKKFGISKEDMAKITLQNPYFITESFDRIKYIQQFLGMVEITDLREMALKHPYALSVNPIKIKRFIEAKREEGINDEEIKNILQNDFDEYIKMGE